jgi:epsilon-lactone hydrolase
MKAMKQLHSVVQVRRRIFGPRRPTWSSEFETLVTAFQMYSKIMPFVPLKTKRRATDMVPPDPHALDGIESEVVTANGVPGEWFRHADAEDGRVVYYLHGGGYVLGSIDSHRMLIGRIAQAAKANVFAIEYRLAPEAPFPAQLEDARAGYRYLLDSGVKPEKIVIAGDSAGGGLTLSTLLELRDDEAPLPAGAALISPWTDITASGGSVRTHVKYDYIDKAALKDCAKMFASGEDPKNPLVSPLFADHRGLPPLLIQAGGCESLLDDSLRLATRAKAAGVSVELDIEADMIHAFHIFAFMAPEARRAIVRLGAFVRRQTSGEATATQGSTRPTRRRTTRTRRRTAATPSE